MQVNNSIIYIPALFKIVFGLIVDSRVITKKRKNFFLVFGSISALCLFLVCSDVLHKSNDVVKVLFLSVFCDTFVDAVMDSLVVQ